MPGGLVGITLNPKCSSKDFLIAPELSHLLAQAKAWQDFQSFSGESSHHHALTTAAFIVVKRKV